MIPINAPQIGEEEIEAVVKVMKSGVLTHGLGTGPMVTKFEKAFAKLVKARHAIAVNTGTSALHSVIIGTGIESKKTKTNKTFTPIYIPRMSTYEKPFCLVFSNLSA